MKLLLLTLSLLHLQLISNAQQTENPTIASRIEILHELSDSCSAAENHSAALDYKRKELKLKLNFNEMKPIVECGEKLGLLYYHLGKYHQSLFCFERTSTFHQKTGNLLSYATNKVNEANVYTRLDKYPQAINRMRLAEDVYKQDTIKFANQLVGLYTNLGLAYFDLPNLDSSAYYYELANKANEIAKKPIYTAVILNNIGDIYLQKDSILKAEEHFKASHQLATELNYSLLIATTKLNLGRIETKRSNYQQAILDLNEALLIYQEINSLYFLSYTSSVLSECYEKMGNESKSLFYLKEFNHLEDSLKGAETLDRIANLETEVALQAEQQKYEIVQKEKELAETKSNYQSIYLYFLIGLIALGLAVAFLLIRGLRASLERNKLKAKQRQELLEKELEFKKKEIENFSTYILEKNSLLNEVKESLIKMKKENPESDIIRDAVQTVSHNLHIDQDRKELDLKIDQAHQEFITRLLFKNPKLTKTEQRLCSLLLMDLSSKDISNIMNVEPESIKKSRNRLRKKLDLEPKADLTEFLKSI